MRSSASSLPEGPFGLLRLAALELVEAGDEIGEAKQDFSGRPLEGRQRTRRGCQAITLAIYQHVLPGDDRAAADIGARLIFGTE